MVAQTPLASVARVGAELPRLGAELLRVGAVLARLAAFPAWRGALAWPDFAPDGAVLARLPASLAWSDAAGLAMLPASAAIATKAPTNVAISRRVGAGRTSGRRTLTSTPLPFGPPGVCRAFLQHSESGIKFSAVKDLLRKWLAAADDEIDSRPDRSHGARARPL